jgi:hypothetical protein
MTATKARVYKPEAQRGVLSLPRSEAPAGGQPNSGAAHAGADEAKPFPIECLPPAAAAMAKAIARAERVPETLSGCCTLGILSASIGAGLQVKSGADRVTRGNLYIVGSAESGSGKSESFRHVARPFHEFEYDLCESWRTQTGPKAETEVEILESRVKKLTAEAGKAADAIEREAVRGELEAAKAELVKVKADCIPPALCCEDVTTEKLAVMLAHNGEQLASLSPDAGAIVNNLLGRYSKLDRTDEVIYLKAFSGDYARVDRQGRESVTLKRPCLAALWLVQPDKVEALLGEPTLTDGGLIPRLLVCHTRAQPQPITDSVEGIPISTVNGWAILVRKLLRTFRLAAQPVTTDPTPETRQAMKKHFNGIVARRLDDLRDVTSYAARWNEQAWRIAVCIHAGLQGERAGEREIDAETASNAIVLADWFAGEQLQILAAGRHAVRQKFLDQVLGMLADKPAGITARDVQRARIAATAEDAHALLARLEAEGELTGQDSKPDTGGHVKRIYVKAR